MVQGNAAKKAAGTQAAASNAATQAQLDMYNQTRADQAPVLQARNDALSRMETLLGVGAGGGTGGIDPNVVMSDPGYQFGLSQGMRAVNNQLNARGMGASGAAVKAADQYATDYATTKYDAALNRQLNPLQSMAGLGQSGANSLLGASMATGQGIGGNILGAGNAAAASQMAQGNIWANTANQLAGWYQNQNRQPGAPGGGWQTPSGSMAGNAGYLDANNPAWANYTGG
jgi:hypothetical protein